ncbi:MAG TPA: hypothetical protein VHM70_04535 [Polyangiaceae bacterium]|nr:hypothetical protein [Polyangiaceae bacterium]
MRLECDVSATCGGCPKITLDSAQQRELKAARLQASMGAAGLPPIEANWLYDDSPVGYRNRIRLRVDDGVPVYFNPHKSVECAVLEPDLRVALNSFRLWAKGYRSELSGLAHLEVRAPDMDGRAGIVYARRPDASSGEPLPHPDGFIAHVLGEGSPRRQRVRLIDDVFAYVPLGSFRQVNSRANQLMLRTVRALADELGCRSFCDLFCGSGNLGLPLLRSGLRGAGIESDEHAVAALIAAAVEQGSDASGFVAGDARSVPPSALCATVPDLLLVDPPRAGLRGDVATVTAVGARHLVLCHCDAASFVRDLCALRAAGYTLARLWLCDMFPHTSHTEIVAYLRV